MRLICNVFYNQVVWIKKNYEIWRNSCKNVLEYMYCKSTLGKTMLSDEWDDNYII